MIEYCAFLILSFIALAIFTLSCAGIIILKISSHNKYQPMENLEKKTRFHSAETVATLPTQR